MIYPTLQCANSQSIIEFGQFSLTLNTEGQVIFVCGAESVTSSNAVSLRRWQRVEAQITKLGQISISLGSLDGSDTFKPTFKQLNLELDLSQNASVVIAGQLNGDAIINCFNGKIEQPEIYVGSDSLASWDLFWFRISHTQFMAITLAQTMMILGWKRSQTGMLTRITQPNSRIMDYLRITTILMVVGFAMLRINGHYLT